MVRRTGVAWAVVAVLSVGGAAASCGGDNGTNGSGGGGATQPAASSGAGGTSANGGGGMTSSSASAGGQAPDDRCDADKDCAKFLGKFSPKPAGCAEAFCDSSTKKCGVRPRDADGDGARVAACAVDDFPDFVAGDDCDDADPAFLPGASRDCSENTQGMPIVWPGGAPQGLCKYGSQTCVNGKASVCVGAVQPAAAPDCSSDEDSTCVGRKDSEICGCRLGDVEDCYTGPDGTEGVGPCLHGSKTCVVNPNDAHMTSFGACEGQTVPAVKDTCTPGADETCDGVPNEGCECTADLPNDGTHCPGACTNGTRQCNLTDGTWTGCSGATDPIACTTTGGCAGTKCAGNATCNGPQTKSCGLCPAVACNATCHQICPPGFIQTGQGCESITTLNGGFGVTTPLGLLTSGAFATVPSGSTLIARYVVFHGTQSTTDHCGNSSTAYPLTFSCGTAQTQISEAQFAAQSQVRSDCDGGTVSVNHTANGTVCCFGGCGRSYGLELHTVISTCGS